MKETLFLFDGTALAYRAYFAFIKNPLINSKGTQTSAVFGVIKSFFKVINDFNAKYIAISFDRKEQTFRHKLTETYKANRPPTPQELISQIEYIKSFFELIGLKEISLPGYEADDILGTIAKTYETQFDIIIVSGDKDFAQLVNDNISLYDNKNDKIIKYQEVSDKYNINPDQFIDYLALIGDSADNIPGAKGIGPKTAAKLLNQYDNIENLYNNISEFPENKEKEKLVNSKENVFLSKTLATIKTDVPIADLNVKDFLFNKKNITNAVSFLDELELTTLKNSLINSQENIIEDTKQEDADYKFILIDNEKQLIDILNKCNSNIIAIDTETTSINPIQARLVGISFCFDKSKAYYIPINHTFADNIKCKTVSEIFNSFLKDKLIIGHNFKYDLHVLTNHRFEIKNKLFDTMLASYLLDPGKNEYSLDKCALREFNYEMIPITNLIGKGKKQISFADIEVNTACEYAAEDALMTYKLYNVYKEKLQNQNLFNLFENIEIPLIFTLQYMENQGVYIDIPGLNKLKLTISTELEKITDIIYKLADEQFNINSTQQLSTILFDKLNIKPLKKTQTGYSTDIAVLEQLAEEHEIAKQLIDYRQLSKMLNTYIEALPLLANPSTHKLHTSFNQTITSTGRLSSTNPNLQNIPIKNELGRKIRSCFCASTPNNVIVSADYSQIELRLLAILSKDESMINAFKNNLDIHTNTASKIFNKAPEEIDSNERRKAKVINFGIIYGMGSQSLSKELSISSKEAKSFIDEYFNHFPTIKDYMDSQKNFAHQNMWVETIYSRRLYLPNINSSNNRLLSEAERIAVNMPIQGSAADIIKIAMNNIYKKINTNPQISMLIQVHDELVFEIDKSILEESISMIKNEMEHALNKTYTDIVPLTVDIGYGENWDTAH